MSKIIVNQGEIYITSRLVRIYTVLGSCVGTIFYAPRTGLGAMSHAMYPRSRQGCLQDLPAPFFVDQALEIMSQRFAGHGVGPEETEAYIFGGGAIFGSNDGDLHRIGQENYAVAIETVHRLGIGLKHEEYVSINGQRLMLDLARHRITLEYLRNEQGWSECP